MRRRAHALRRRQPTNTPASSKSPPGAAGTCTSKPAAAATPATAATKAASDGAWSQIAAVVGEPPAHQQRHTRTPAIIGGTLLAPEARGTRELRSPPPTQAGPGVYSVTVQADGQTLYSGHPRQQRRTVRTAVGDRAAARSCSTRASPASRASPSTCRSTPPSLHDGRHTLKVTVTDAAQNTSVVYDNTITHPQRAREHHARPRSRLRPGATRQHAHRRSRASGRPPPAPAPPAYSYQWQDCNSEGKQLPARSPAPKATATPPPPTTSATPYGCSSPPRDSDGSTSVASPRQHRRQPASTVIQPPPDRDRRPGPASTPSSSPEHPTGRAQARTRSCTSPGTRPSPAASPAAAFTITGRLANASGGRSQTPRSTYANRPTGTGSPQVIGHASTAANGTFTVHVPAGPSRLVLIDYRAFSSDPLYSAQADRPGERQRRCADAHHATAQRPNREDHPARTGSRPDTARRASSSSCSCTTAEPGSRYATPRHRRERTLPASPTSSKAPSDASRSAPRCSADKPASPTRTRQQRHGRCHHQLRQTEPAGARHPGGAPSYDGAAAGPRRDRAGAATEHAAAHAGTYQMHQCTPGDPAVSPGWCVYAYDSQASTVLHRQLRRSRSARRLRLQQRTKRRGDRERQQRQPGRFRAERTRNAARPSPSSRSPRPSPPPPVDR